MAETKNKAVAGPLDTLFRVGVLGGLSDAVLLERFLDGGPAAEAAFEALVGRHGPMVLGVCRRLLRDEHEAADAFQATFLILVRRAGAVRKGDSLGPWLYGVARRVALRQKAETAVRRARESRAAIGPSATKADTPQDDPYIGLYAEIDRLPEKYRSPVVLCHLQGRTIDDASRQLGWPAGTVAGRLARARGLLRSRLARRGFALGLAVTATDHLAPDAQADASPALFRATSKAATLSAAGKMTADNPGLVSSQAIALSEGVLHAMSITRLKGFALSLAVAGSLMTAAGVLAYQPAPHRPEQPQTNGSEGPTTSNPRLPSPTNNAPHRLAGGGPGVISPEVMKAARDSTRLVNIARLSQMIATSDKSPKTKELLAKLEEPIAMKFADETPLEKVLNYIKSETREPNANDIPIYVDPVGLKEAGKTMTSPVVLDLEGVALKTTLRLLLKQIGLAYCVKDGVVIISSPIGVIQELTEASTQEQREELDLSKGFP